MNKLLVEVICPMTNQSYDFYIPVGLTFSEIKMLIAKTIENNSINTYFKDNQIILCDFETGKILYDEKTPQDLNIKNGYRMLIM
ncbi:MAG: hypothetical protein K2P09_00035 [Erysipelotrichales bacterium]|nr:hypothetical protein [Erysipelotrichales bacterium]